MIHAGKTSLKIMLLGVFLPLIQLAAAPKTELQILPDPVRTGEDAYLVIRSNDGSRNTPRRLPKVDGLTWQSGIRQQSRIEIVNGRRSSVFEAYVPFIVTRPGKYTIPGFRLTHSSDRTDPVSFEAVESRYPTRRTGTPQSSRSSDESLTADQIMFMEMDVPGKRGFYYLGEEIPLEVNIFVLRRIRPQLSWPQIVFGEKGSAVFRDHRKVNPENPQFSGVTQREIERDGRPYVMYSFRTAIRPISAGKLELTAKENAAMVVPDNRRQRSRDPFFDDFFEDSFFSMNRQVPRNMSAGPLTLDIRNLPPVPDGVRYTGLAGSWDARVSLSPPPYKVGETITLKIEFDGAGSTDTLRSWPLDLPGFRVYPPEVEKNGSGARIRYVLIPTEPTGEKTAEIAFGPFATFENGKYQVHDFRRAVRIEPGTGVIPAAVGPVTVEQTPSAPAARKAAPARRRAEEILYLKKHDGRHLSMPLTRNLAAGAFLILAGVIFFCIACIVRLVRSRHENDPVYRQKLEARKKKPELIARLKTMSAEEFPGDCAGDIASYVADAEGLAHGADLTECAEAVREKSPELAKMLDDLSQAAWMPSLKARFTPGFRRALVKALSRLAVLALALFPTVLSGAEKASVPGSDAEALNAYDTGKFGEAEKYYRARLNPAEPSAELLYNLGGCLYQQGKLPQALVCFERALRLSPRDPDILENLNLVRRKLIREEHGKVGSPADILPYLRDSLRPDEWLTLLCAGIALLFCAGGFRLLGAGPKLFRSLLTAGILLIAVPGIAYYSQQKTSYDPDRAVVVSKALPVYSLPSDQAGKVEMTLHAGDEAVIAERRLDWVRIRTGSAEGWVHASGVASLWSPESAAALQ